MLNFALIQLAARTAALLRGMPVVGTNGYAAAFALAELDPSTRRVTWVDHPNERAPKT